MINRDKEKSRRTSEEYFYKGHECVNIGDFNSAIENYTKALLLEPNRKSILFSRGIAWSKKGEHDKAIDDLSKAIRLDPSDARVWNSRGVVRSEKGEYDKAIVDLNEAIRLDPDHAFARSNRGNIWLAKGKYDKAIADYTEAIRLNPNLANAWHDRGIAWAQKNCFDKAIADLDKASYLDPDYLNTTRNLDVIRAILKKLSNGISAYRIEKDSTIYDSDGNIIFFSFRRFQKDICKGEYCFVCGAEPNASFNNEHVIPNWLQREAAIHNKKLLLPNENFARYSTYKISCCADCNAKLGKIYEAPISQIFSKGYNSLIEYLKEEDARKLLCSWLSLIFFKLYLKDFENPVSLDTKKNNGMIGDGYDLQYLHHIHAIARAVTVGIEIDTRVFGSLVILPIENAYGEELFDFCDSLYGRTLMIRIKNVALIYVLDDCCATIDKLQNRFKSIPDNISPIIWLREMCARYATCNMHLESRPNFKTEYCRKQNRARITVDLPTAIPKFSDCTPSLFGKMLADKLKNYKDVLNVNGQAGDEDLNKIKSGCVTFFNE